jgi:hypothetical protein
MHELEDHEGLVSMEYQPIEPMDMGKGGWFKVGCSACALLKIGDKTLKAEPGKFNKCMRFFPFVILSNGQ